MKMITQSEVVQLEPYVGPVPFEAKDEALFFGRESESDELLSLAIAHPVVLMYAQSGAGKTSLLNARLVPKLKQEAYEVLPTARAQGNECDLSNNIYVFNTLMSWTEGRVDGKQLRSTSLVEFLEGKIHFKNNVGWEVPRFAIFDQFEEFFTAYPQRWQERKEFFDQVREALDKDYLLRVIFAMREDYVAELDAYASLLPEKLRTRFRLERPREKAALAAITSPLRAVKTARHFADGVAEQLVENLLMIPADMPDGEARLGQFVEPVQLQVVCQSLWRALTPNDTLITYDHLKNCGDVTRALSDFYEGCVATAVEETGIKEGHLREWFSNTLITSEFTRGMVFRGANDTGAMPNAVIDVLEKLHIIKEDKRGRARWYELAHDRFIDPIRRSNDNWWSARAGAVETRRRLEAKASQWMRSGGVNEGLFDEAELLEANRWLTSAEAADFKPSDTLLALISASSAAIEGAAAARKVEQAQALLAEQRRRLRQFRWGLAIVGALFIAMSGLAVFAYQKSQAATQAERIANERKEEALLSKGLADQARNDAVVKKSEAQFQRDAAEKARKQLLEQKNLVEQQKNFAEQQKNLAEKARADADKARADAVARKRDAETQQAIAIASEWASDAMLQLPKDPQLSLLLAVEASKEAPRNERIPSVSNALRESYLSANDRSVLSGHQGTVWQSAFTPDGKFVVTAGEDHSVRLWEPTSGRLLKKLEGHGGPVHALAISGDGRLIATEAADETAKIWDTTTGQLLHTLGGLNGPVATLAFSQDGTKLITETCNDQTSLWEATVWDAGNGRAMAVLRGHHEAVSAVAISPDGRLVATASWDKTARVWDAKTGALIADLSGHKAAVNSVAFSPGSDKLVTTSYDRTARVWDIAAAKSILTLEGHAGSVHSASFSPDGKWIVTASRRLTSQQVMVNRDVPLPDELQGTATEGNTARIWEAATGRRVAVLNHDSDVYSATFSPDSRYVVTASKDGKARVWEANTGQRVAELLGHSGPVYHATFSPDGKFVVTSSVDGTARVWEIGSKEQTVTITTDKAVSTARFLHGGIVATITENGVAHLWNAQTGDSVRDFQGDKNAVYQSAMSPDGKLIVSASRKTEQSRLSRSNRRYSEQDRSARVWEAQTGRLIFELKDQDQTEPVRKVRFSSNGQSVLTVSYDGARLWDLTTGRKIASLPARSYMNCAALSPDEKLVATGDEGGEAHIWRLSSGDVVPLTGHIGGILDVEFSPDGSRVITASADGTARVWNAHTGQTVMELRGHTGPILSAAFSPDGKWIVTASEDKNVKIWEAGTAEVVMTLSRHADIVYSAAFSEDSKSVLTASADGTARVFACDVCVEDKELQSLAQTRVTRKLSPAEECKYLLHKPAAACMKQ